MLVLNRRIGEVVMIADDISVVVLGVKGTQVRLGFTADSRVPIHRKEIHQRIQREQARLNESSPTARPHASDATLRLNRSRPDVPAGSVARSDRDSWVDE